MSQDVIGLSDDESWLAGSEAAQSSLELILSYLHLMQGFQERPWIEYFGILNFCSVAR
jgi:hypothetical protein